MELWEVDVFADGPLSGNPLAVVRADDADRVPTTEHMLAFTRWQGFSETTFLVPTTRGDADYGVRIFTPDRELPFAGHPTLGTCHAWLEAGGSPHDPDVIVQECGAGLVRIRRGDDGRLAFAAPPLVRSGPVEDDRLAEVLEVVGVADAGIVDAAWVDNGPGWLALLLRDTRAVLAVDADFTRWRRDEPLSIGLVGLHDGEVDPRIEVRALFNDEHGRMREDPVTGSLNASVAQWLLATGRVTAPYTARQGTKLGRRGRVHVTSDDGQVWVGGTTSTVAVGRLVL